MGHVVGNLRPLAAVAIIGPAFRQEQFAVQEAMEVARRVIQMHGHHAIVDLARGPAPLTLHPRGLVALLGMPRLVNDADGTSMSVPLSNPLLKCLPHPNLVPGVQGQEVLQVPRAPAGSVGYRFHALSVQVGQLARDVRPQVPGWLASAKTVIKSVQVCFQQRPQSLNLLGVHSVSPSRRKASGRSLRLAA